MLEEVLAALSPKAGETIVDGTFGAGGYTRAILDAGAHVVAIDRDPDAISAGRALEAQSGGRLRLVHGRFSALDSAAGEAVDGVVLDIGVSSMQLDEAERGFSFRHDGPLDMRMERQGPGAADVVNAFKPGDLARIFGFYGEERHAGRIARMIEKRRARKPGDRIHPATRAFQGLRIFINDELGELGRALFAAERALKPGGRLVVVTFHSLEDRMVKRFLADRSGRASGSRHLPAAVELPATFDKPARAIAASEREAEENPRARSARLRAATRTAAAARAPDASIFGLPSLPAISGER
jgi:16S rRNA (cytosine1402-N4)-methyltransferase